MTDHFSIEELAILHRHGLVLYANRVIFEAQPPMPADQIAAVQALCAGPIPQPLLDLWQLTAGGRLDYDLTLRMNGNEEAIRWSELFFNGSDGERDLQGWIDHELALVKEETPSWNGKLTALPLGGFEYRDRIYAVVEPGSGQGQILAWKQGLPPAWTHALHEDGLGVIATDLHAAFATLHLDEDPLAPSGDYFSGQTLMAWLDERHESHGLELELMDKLVAFYRLAMVDWRTPLAEGTLRHQPNLVHVAMRHAIATDDALLVAELAAAGVTFEGPLLGSAIATDVALGQGAFAATAALVRAGAPVAADALGAIDNAISPELTGALLDNGAEPDVLALVRCVACGAPASARLIAEACARVGIDVPAAYELDRDAMLAELESSLAKVRDGKLEHYLGAEGLALRIDHLQSFML